MLRTRYIPVQRRRSAAPSGEVLFFDEVSYTIGRLDSGASKSSALATAGYAGLKDEVTNPSGALGYIYTTNAIEGDVSGIPGGGNALVLESLGGTLSGQTDFYVLYPPTVADPWPSDLWVQFWFYVQNDAGSGKESEFHPTRNKFFYPVLGDSTAYPNSTHDTAWLMGICGQGSVVDLLGSGSPIASGAGTFSWVQAPNPWFTDIRAFIPALEGTGEENRQMANLSTVAADVYMNMNTWYLVRMHFDISGAPDTDSSKLEIWWREKGAQAGGLTKRAEWIGGSSAQYNYYNRHTDNTGVKALKCPTTIGNTSAPWYDSYMYMKDVLWASGSDVLPDYGSY